MLGEFISTTFNYKKMTPISIPMLNMFWKPGKLEEEKEEEEGEEEE